MRAILGDIYDARRAQNLGWLATYLPADFCHVIHIPVDLHPLGGTRRGKKEAIERLRLIAEQFDFVVFDTSGLLIDRNRAAHAAANQILDDAANIQSDSSGRAASLPWTIRRIG
ncbi:MAG: hypothetical protein WBB72_13815 [Methyloceanibacter sp.]